MVPLLTTCTRHVCACMSTCFTGGIIIKAHAGKQSSVFAPEKSNSEEIRARAKCLVITNAKKDEITYLLPFFQ